MMAPSLKPLDEGSGQSLLRSSCRGYVSEPSTPTSEQVKKWEATQTRAECIFLLLLCALALGGFTLFYLKDGWRALGSR